MDPYVRNTQVWLNDHYASNPDIPYVTEDGLTGWQTVNTLVLALQFELDLPESA